MYQSVIGPAMLCGIETLAMTEKQVGKIEVAELKMVRWALSVTKKDKTKNEYVRKTAKIAKLGQTSGHKITLVWTREEERRRLLWEKNDRDVNIRKNN